MINLEVWVPPDEDTIPILDRNDVKECGLITSPGRFGWFIPKNLSRLITNNDAKWGLINQDVDWKFFENEDFVSAFDVTDPVMAELIANASMDNDQTYVCNFNTKSVSSFSFLL